MTTLALTNIRPWGAAPVDVLIAGDTIAEVRPAGGELPTGERIEGAGLLALPGFVNAHAHVDKSWWGQPWVSYGGERTTQGRIAHERKMRDQYGIPSVDGVVRVLREFIRHGTTATRSHVDVDLGVELRGLDYVREAIAQLDGAIEVEMVAFPQDGVIRRPGVLDLLDRAAAQPGISLIGGLDPAVIDRDPIAQIDGLFGIAERRDVGLDFHLHDGGELGAYQFELIIDRTLRLGLHGKVTISHGFALGELPAARQDDLIGRLGEAGIAWATVSPVRSAPLPWRKMRDHGIGIGLGTDGIRDLWSPYGDGDILRVALRFAEVHGMRHDEEFRTAVELATTGGGRYVDRAQHDITAGARADIVLLDAENVQDALMRTPLRKLVISGGQIVARDGDVLI